MMVQGLIRRETRLSPPGGGNLPFGLSVDLATSTMSNGDLRVARDEGRKVPLGTGLGQGGRDTEEPDEILTHGGALPFGRRSLPDGA